MLDGDGNCFEARFGLEFAEDIGDVIPHGVDTHEEPSGDLGGRLTSSEELENFDFPSSEVAAEDTRVRTQMCDERGHEILWNLDLSCNDGPDGGNELAEVGLFWYEAGATCFEGLGEDRTRAEARQHNDLDVRLFRLDLLRRFCAGAVR